MVLPAVDVEQRLRDAPQVDRPAADLNNAQQKMLDLARALATRPRLLLLDELAADPMALASLGQSTLSDLDQKIPAELRERDPLLKPLSAAVLADALASARQRLLGAISAEDAP